MGDILTPEEIATEWRLEVATVRRWIREGKLKATKLGRGWRIKRADWDAFMKSEAGEPKKVNGLAFSH